MGRYYNGDINGKLWFAIQSSDDADFFGCVGERPESLKYSYHEEDLKRVEEGIEKCEKALGKSIDLINNYKWKKEITNEEDLKAFFDENDSYNEEQLADLFGWTRHKVVKNLVWYARLILGRKIQKCIKEKRQCYFTVEL